MPNIYYTRVRDFLYTLLILEDKYPIKAIAPLMNVAPSTLHGYTEGVQYFPPDLLANLYNATILYDARNGRPSPGEMRIWDVVLADTGLVAVPINHGQDEDPVEKDLLDSFEELGGLSALVRDALEDGVITENECDRIHSKAASLQREIVKVCSKTKPGRKR